MCVQSLSQPCPTLVPLWTVALPVCGILQARILEWVTMPSSRGSSWPGDQTHVTLVSCPGRILYSLSHLGSTSYVPYLMIVKALFDIKKDMTIKRRFQVGQSILRNSVLRANCMVFFPLDGWSFWWKCLRNADLRDIIARPRLPSFCHSPEELFINQDRRIDSFWRKCPLQL